MAGARGSGVKERLQHKDSGALAERKSGALHVEGHRGSRGERSRRMKSSIDEGMKRLGPSDNHLVADAVLDQREPFPESHGTRGAGGAGGEAGLRPVRRQRVHALERRQIVLAQRAPQMLERTLGRSHHDSPARGGVLLTSGQRLGRSGKQEPGGPVIGSNHSREDAALSSSSSAGASAPRWLHSPSTGKRVTGLIAERPSSNAAKSRAQPRPHAR